jgi:glutaredoxin 2
MYIYCPYNYPADVAPGLKKIPLREKAAKRV